jgi:hypothetical protein
LFILGSAAVHGQSTAVSSVAPPSTVYDLEPLGKKPEADKTKPLIDWLPIWGKRAQDKGFDLPLPFGLGLTYTYTHQNMVVSDLVVEGRPVAGLTFKDAPTTTHTGVFRADAWVFPFLNIYALVGETSGTTQPVVVFPNGQRVKSDVDYDRFSYGAGLTLAGGYKAFFLTIDANYTTGPIVSTQKGQIGDKPIESFTFTPRLGMLVSSAAGSVRVRSGSAACVSKPPPRSVTPLTLVIARGYPTSSVGMLWIFLFMFSRRINGIWWLAGTGNSTNVGRLRRNLVVFLIGSMSSPRWCGGSDLVHVRLSS